MHKKLIPLLVVLLTVASFFAGKVSASKQSDVVNPEIEETSELETIEDTNEYLSHEAYRSLYTSIDYQDVTTYVIGHKSPDTDTVTSAMAMANLLTELGIDAKARVAGEINSETAYALDYFGIEAPELLESGDGQQLWLVDHSESTQAVDGIENARIVGIVDHHGIGNLSNEELIVIRSGCYGSTTGEIYTLYKECGITIDRDTARLMLTGLLSDLSFFKSGDNELNREIYDELLKIAEVEDLEKLEQLMKEGKLDYADKSDEEIFYHDYKDYEENGITYGIGNIKVATVNNVEDMYETMKQVAQSEIETKDVDYLFWYIYDFDYEKGYLGCVSKDASKANELLTKAFGEQYEVLDGYLVTSPSVSRKTDLVPCINEALKD